MRSKVAPLPRMAAVLKDYDLVKRQTQALEVAQRW